MPFVGFVVVVGCSFAQNEHEIPRFIGFPNAMNMHIRERMKDPRSNPFHFKHVSELRSAAHLDDSGPSVVLASPGMLQNSTSRELFEAWCTDPKNGIIIAGYSVEGTLAKEISTESVDKIDTLGGQKLPLRMSVESISFAAHVDYVQNRDFVRATSAPKVCWTCDTCSLPPCLTPPVKFFSAR